MVTSGRRADRSPSAKTLTRIANEPARTASDAALLSNRKRPRVSTSDPSSIPSGSAAPRVSPAIASLSRRR